MCLIASAMNATQEKASIGDFTKSSTEHIINWIEQPFVIRSIQGSVFFGGADRVDPLANVLFEIQGPDTDKKIRRARTDEHGQFKISGAPSGTYKFKATLSGFQSVMGTITVSKKAPKDARIKVSMQFGV